MYQEPRVSYRYGLARCCCRTLCKLVSSSAIRKAASSSRYHLLAIGDSTNAVIHLAAIAGRAGLLVRGLNRLVGQQMNAGYLAKEEKVESALVAAEFVPIDAALAAYRQAQFSITDILRRAQGDALEAFGLGPSESPYKVIASGPFWCHRDYSEHVTAQSLLIVAAPIKRPYIWDLAPSASAIRYCLGQGLHVHLLEWLPALPATGDNGLAEYTKVISECVARISGKNVGEKPFLMGHSLGGTFAAIFAALASESIRGLVLLSAPLCFRPATSRFRDGLVSLVPSGFAEAGPCPGSLLSQISALASPDTFIWSRLTDAALSVTDRHALEIHGRVERWALDEAPLPGKLVHQIIEWLYREDHFCRSNLKVDDTPVGPLTLSVPTLAVVNTADEVAPLDSVKPFIDRIPTKDAHIVEYSGEIGVCLQHLGILIGRKARAQVWPDIISWIVSRHI
jgi:polyhydroxyalkanoate synthase